MKALYWTVPRVRATATILRLAARYPGSADRLAIKIQARDVLNGGFPEALAGIKAVRSGLRSVRRPGSSHAPTSQPNPYNQEPFAARETRTLYVHDVLGDPAISGDFQAAIARLLDHAQSHGRFEICIALNFYAGGGAEQATLHYIRHYASRVEGSVLLVITDPGPRKDLPPLPENGAVVDAADFAGFSTLEHGRAILLNSLLAFRPGLLHIVNSVAGWELLRAMPRDFVPGMKVISSNFALQFANPDRTEVVGYAATYLPPCISKLDAVVTDNGRFAEEGPDILGLAAQRDKFRVVYNPSRMADTVTLDDAISRLEARVGDMRASSRLKIVWAGRLDEEKRIDLLLAAAKLTEHFCDFHVYGDAVVSREGSVRDALRRQPNVKFNGPFTSPFEWERNGAKHIFFFTSRWEGMPNVLIEAAYLGMPVCAMDVGGVGELIRKDTGWLLGEQAGADRFAKVFEQLKADPDEVRRRTRNLVRLVRAQHDREAFARQMDCLMASLDLPALAAAVPPEVINSRANSEASPR